MGKGNTSKTTSNYQNSSQNVTNPNIPPWMQALQSQFGGAAQQQLATAQQPVFGEAQQAGYLQNLNDLANASTKHLASTLSSRGALDSGAFGAGASDIERTRLSGAQNFFANLPFQERAAQQQNVGGALSMGEGVMRALPFGQTSNSSASGSSEQDTTQQQGWGSMLGSLLGGAAGFATGGLSGLAGGLGGLFGGGGVSGGSPGANASAMGAGMGEFNPMTGGFGYQLPTTAPQWAPTQSGVGN